jgi:archaellum component FlaC
MLLDNVNEQIEKLTGLKIQEKNAVLKLIDLKTENDMDKVLSKIDARFDRIDARFEKMEDKLDNLQKFIWGVIVVLAMAIISFILKG